jgi:hypothetical protein
MNSGARAVASAYNNSIPVDAACAGRDIAPTVDHPPAARDNVLLGMSSNRASIEAASPVICAQYLSNFWSIGGSSAIGTAISMPVLPAT